MNTEMTVRNRVNAGEYENHLTYCLDAEKSPHLMRIKELKAEIEALTEKNKQWAQQQKALYGAETARLTDKFRTDLEAEHGMTGHPKAAALWSSV